MAFVRAAAEEDLWEGETIARRVEGRRVLLARIDGTVRAYEDRCAHLGLPLSEGSVLGPLLTCGAHRWQYDQRTGRGVNPSTACLARFAVAVRDGGIFVDVSTAAAGERPA